MMTTGFRFGSSLASIVSRNRTAVNLPDRNSDLWAWRQASFESLKAAQAVLLSLGVAVKVLEPLPLRWSIRDYAEQVLSIYVRSKIPTTLDF
jgi:hypothetical protein